MLLTYIDFAPGFNITNILTIFLFAKENIFMGLFYLGVAGN